MYTLCPLCETAFKVTAEQLHAAGGRVRCGKCSAIFNAVAHLIDQAPPSANAPETVANTRREKPAASKQQWVGPLEEKLVERRVGERRSVPAPSPETRTAPEVSSQTAILEQFLSESLAESASARLPAQTDETPPLVEELPFPAAGEMTAVGADGSLADLSWMDVSRDILETGESAVGFELEQRTEPEVLAGADAPAAARQRSRAAKGASPEDADERERAVTTSTPPREPVTAARGETSPTDEEDELGLSDEDWDQLLFDDEHGIQEYLEERKAKSKKRSPPPKRIDPTLAPARPETERVAKTSTEQPRVESTRPVQDMPVERDAEADSAVQSAEPADENFEEAVEALLTSLADSPDESLDKSDAPAEPKRAEAGTANAKLSLVEEPDAAPAQPSDFAAADEPAAPFELQELFAPPSEEVVLSDDLSNQAIQPDDAELAVDPVLQSISPMEDVDDDDPLSRAGSEDYTFPLYLELEERSAALNLEQEGTTADSDEGDFAFDDTAATGENPVLSEETHAAGEQGEMEMLEFPLEEAVEFEIPTDEDRENTTAFADAASEAELPVQPRKKSLKPAEPPLEVLDAEERPRPRASKRLYWGGATLLLMLVLAVQLVHYNRDALLLHPTFGPWLQSAYASVGLRLVPPGDLSQYDIRLHVAPAIEGTIQISATLSNKADHVQPYPLVRLVLEDRWQEPVGALIVEPADYLAQAANATGLMAPRERVEAQIEVLDPGPDAQSYKLDVCLRHSQGRLLCADDS